MTTNKGQLRITIAYWVINLAIVCYIALFVWSLINIISSYIFFWGIYDDWKTIENENFSFNIEAHIIIVSLATIAAAFFLYALFLVRRFLIQFRKAEYFNTTSIKSLKKIAISVLFFVLLGSIQETLKYFYLFDHHGNNALMPIIAFYVSLTFLAIFIWLVLPAFFAGRELKNETDLTV